MKVHLYHANAGHGHRKVAEVIAATLRKKGAASQSLFLADALDFTPVYFRASYPAIYFNSVKYIPGIWGCSYEMLDRPGIYRVLYPLRSLFNRIMGGRLLKHVGRENPDVILCTHFFTAELFARARREGRLASKLITVITDFYPHSFWVNEGTDYYWVMGEEGRSDLIRRGVSAGRIVAGGIPVEETFKPLGKKQEILEKYQFQKDRLTLLFTSGSFGLGQQEAILAQIREIHENRLQCFVVCGNNAGLKQRLEAQSWPFPIKIFGFVDFMPELMEASDLALAKSGGSTTTEALAKGLPMVILDPIPGQETRNARLLLDSDAAFTLAHPHQIRTVLKAIIDNPELLPAKRREIKRLARPNAAGDLADFLTRTFDPEERKR